MVALTRDFVLTQANTLKCTVVKPVIFPLLYYECIIFVFMYFFSFFSDIRSWFKKTLSYHSNFTSFFIFLNQRCRCPMSQLKSSFFLF